jgi:hypothetical protein
MTSPSHIWPKGWVLFTALGLFSGALIVSRLPSLIEKPIAIWMTAWLIVGVAVGIMQQFILARWGFYLTYWVITYVVGAPLGIALGSIGGFIAGGFTLSIFIEASTQPNFLDRLSLPLATAVGGVTAGAITGAVLGALQTRLFSQRGYRATDWVSANMSAWSASGALVGAGLALLDQFDNYLQALICFAAIAILCGALAGRLTLSALLQTLASGDQLPAPPSVPQDAQGSA